MDKEKATTLYLMRHGETSWNAERRLQGQTDIPLCSNGIEQAKKLSQDLKNIPFTAIFSSDLQRARATAIAIAAGRDLAIQEIAGLRERTHGYYEGQSIDVFNKAMADIQHMPEAERRKFMQKKGIEHTEEVISRFMQSVREVVANHPGRTVGIITHGGCMRRFLEHVGYARPGDLPAGALRNAGYIKVLSDGTEFDVLGVRGVDQRL